MAYSFENSTDPLLRRAYIDAETRPGGSYGINLARTLEETCPGISPHVLTCALIKSTMKKTPRQNIEYLFSAEVAAAVCEANALTYSMKADTTDFPAKDDTVNLLVLAHGVLLMRERLQEYARVDNNVIVLDTKKQRTITPAVAQNNLRHVRTLCMDVLTLMKNKTSQPALEKTFAQALEDIAARIECLRRPVVAEEFNTAAMRFKQTGLPNEKAIRMAYKLVKNTTMLPAGLGTAAVLRQECPGIAHHAVAAALLMPYKDSGGMIGKAHEYGISDRVLDILYGLRALESGCAPVGPGDLCAPDENVNLLILASGIYDMEKAINATAGLHPGVTGLIYQNVTGGAESMTTDQATDVIDDTIIYYSRLADDLFGKTTQKTLEKRFLTALDALQDKRCELLLPPEAALSPRAPAP